LGLIVDDGRLMIGAGAAAKGRARVIDAHCHAGHGVNFGKDNPPSRKVGSGRRRTGDAGKLTGSAGHNE
jgi:hypothetical protein